jgi:hypothetical protein
VLLTWISGILAFAIVLNWSVNARSLLPMTPAVAIVAARRFARANRDRPGARGRWPVLAAGAAIAVLVAWADLRLANAGRDAVLDLAGKLRAAPTVWFQGHWGFQYYAQLAGWRPYDFLRDRVEPGMPIVVPANGTNAREIPATVLRTVQTWPVLPGLSTMNREAKAGFYADVWGPLPFAVGHVPAERYLVFQRVEAR